MSEDFTKPHLIDLPTVPDVRGSLTFAEANSPLPFQPQRAYWIHGIPSGATRGGHAHIRTQEAIIAVAGSFRVHLTSPGRKEIQTELNSPKEALIAPPMWWRVIDNYSGNALCLVLASHPYDEADYIRSESAFFT